MTNDIKQARQRRLRSARRGAWDRWAGKVSYDIKLTWPAGLLGGLVAVVMLLAPTGLLIASTWIARRLSGRRRDSDEEPRAS